MDVVHRNYSQCCRLCLMDNIGLLKTIFDDNGLSALVDRISASLGIKILMDDIISTMICQECIGRIKTWDSFKEACIANQHKLETWMNNENKDDVVSIKSTNDEDIENETTNDTKNETEESSNQEDMALDEEIMNKPETTILQDAGMIHLHNNKEKSVETTDDNVEHDQSEGEDSKDDFTKTKEEDTKEEKKELEEPDKEKLVFAGALKLAAKAANGVVATPYNLTKVEICYIDKCKKVVMMLNTYSCICHNLHHKTMKRLFAHLRPLCRWFPVYTCYNCMITFSDRSSVMRHNSKCTRKLLENLLKVSAMKEPTEIKIRLYQSYRCTACNYTFNFHDDYCNHIDVKHPQDQFPFCCPCDTKFNTQDEYKKHMYYGCTLSHYCDICFEQFETLDDFRQHVEEVHDQEDGFDFLPVSSEITMHKINKSYETSLNSLNAQLNAAAVSASEKLEAVNDSEMVECAPDLEMDSYENSYTESVDTYSPAKRSKSNNWGQKANCTVCGKVYSNFHNMLRHLKTHNDTEKNIPCEHCDEMFRLKSHLKDHLIVAHGMMEANPYKRRSEVTSNAINYPCPECNLIFTSVEEWTQHKRIHMSNVCRECGKEFFTQSEYAKHNCTGATATATSGSSNYTCQVCMTSFGTTSDLREHMLVHIKQEPSDEPPAPKRKKYSCEPCNKHYVGYGGLWEHNKRYHPEKRYKKDYPRQCKYCDKVLMTGGAYFMHKQTHEKSGQKGQSSKTTDQDDDGDYFTCKKCFKVFTSKVKLKAHMKCHGAAVGRTSTTKGGKFKTYWCNICHQACNGFMELQSHKQEHEVEKMNEMQETVRNIANNSPTFEEHDDDLAVHVHEDDDAEGIEYSDGEQQALDILEIQDDVTYSCNVCQLEFSTEQDLEVHKTQHEIEKPKTSTFMYCKYCKIAFRNLENLQEHMQYEHDEQVPVKKYQNTDTTAQEKYPCTMCKKVFDTNGALSSHQGWHKRVKAGEKGKILKQAMKEYPSTSAQKFSCKTCYQSFINDTALQIHILEVHRNINTTVIMPRCEPCALDFETQAALEKHNQFHKLVEKQKEGKKLQYICKFCNKAFFNIEALNTHVEEYHRVVTPAHVCKICKRGFDRPQALATHIKTHNKPTLVAIAPKIGAQKFLYSCSICHMGFNIPKELRNHIITSHPF